MVTIHIKRIYEPSEKKDGFRVLVDRLWPRGLKKETADIDEWVKDTAPSASLRKWFNHEPEKWQEFKQRYKAELKENEAISGLSEQIKDHKVSTLLYAARDEQHNHAIVLQHFLTDKLT